METTKTWRNRIQYEDAPEYDDKRYTVRRMSGIAFWVLGWEVEADEDTEWSGCYNQTGNLLAVMVGDDHAHVVDPSDLTEIPEDDYCSECGQVGCKATAALHGED